MSSQGLPFCAVCREAMIRRLYDRAALIEGELRREGDTVTADVARASVVRARWLVNDVVVQDTDGYQPLEDVSSYVVSGQRAEVRLQVFDEQAPVRKDRCDLVFSRKLGL